MEHFIISLMGLSIPILALLIPLVAVTSKFLVKPVADLMTERLKAQQAGGTLATGASQPDPRIAELEHQVAELQTSLERVLQEQEFDRQLRIGPPHG